MKNKNIKIEKNKIKKRKDKNMCKQTQRRCCKGCVLKAQSITSAEGITTVTVESGALMNLCRGEYVQVGIFTNIPLESQCNEIQITDTEMRFTVFNSGSCPKQPCNQYWRPCRLRCRTILVLQYLDDPEVFVLKQIKQ